MLMACKWVFSVLSTVGEIGKPEVMVLGVANRVFGENSMKEVQILKVGITLIVVVLIDKDNSGASYVYNAYCPLPIITLLSSRCFLNG